MLFSYRKRCHFAIPTEIQIIQTSLRLTSTPCLYYTTRIVQRLEIERWLREFELGIQKKRYRGRERLDVCLDMRFVRLDKVKMVLPQFLALNAWVIEGWRKRLEKATTEQY